MDGVNVYLALNAYDVPDTTSIVPVFQAIYGGYYFAMGSEFFADDLLSGNGDGDVFAAKVTQQYMLGSQLGITCTTISLSFVSLPFLFLLVFTY
jgi:hypothetical protein